MVTAIVLAEVCPTATLENARVVGLNESGTTPVPLSLTSCGLVPAESLKVSTPETAPAALGAKVTFTVQVPFAASEVEQLLVWLKSPLVAIEFMLSEPDPELVRVMAFEALLVPAA